MKTSDLTPEQRIEYNAYMKAYMRSYYQLHREKIRTVINDNNRKRVAFYAEWAGLRKLNNSEKAKIKSQVEKYLHRN